MPYFDQAASPRAPGPFLPTVLPSSSPQILIALNSKPARCSCASVIFYCHSYNTVFVQFGQLSSSTPILIFYSCHRYHTTDVVLMRPPLKPALLHMFGPQTPIPHPIRYSTAKREMLIQKENTTISVCSITQTAAARKSICTPFLIRSEMTGSAWW